jgi:hypothetical protein
MAWLEEIMDKIEGKFALTGWGVVLQPVRHGISPMARHVFVVKSWFFRTDL